MKLSVIIPCLNEVKTIKAVLSAVKTACPQEKEIIVVDDYSTDGTREILKELEIEWQRAEEPTGVVLKVLYHPANLGKGAAVRTGVKSVTGDVVIIQDADLEYSPDEYPKLIEPIIKNRADVVFGSRFIGGECHRVLYFWHRVGNGILTLLSNIFTNLNLTDIETCYKVFRREVIQAVVIEEDGFGFEPEVTTKVSKMKCRIYEVGISYYGRTYAEGKKIIWKDGLWAVYCIVKYNLFR